MLIKKIKNLALNFGHFKLGNQPLRYLNAVNLSNHIDLNTVPSDFDNEIYKKILDQEDAFGIKKIINIEELFNHRCHLGHKLGLLNEHMKPYLFGSRQGLAIIDLNKTADHLFKALNFAAHIAFRNGIILFINPSKETAHITEKTAIDCGEYSNCRNFDPKMLLAPETYFKMSIRLPDLIIIMRTQENNFEITPAIETAAQLLIPTIGIVDIDTDPRLITYPVPGNDDTDSSIEMFSKLFKEAILLGKEKHKQLFSSNIEKSI